ncbi:hypothetical protein [Rubinisphaera margarita]|uniref:hypothetical protein n=1 Tax=Rubinisphaera margarita TaxID=2909586 RepID=UPI001EE99C2D|nr:hypothetical protein [Rubinisphaera margarita]MCG6157507.1 hypothetical protein [Rubinisphaera margarita]
MNLKPLDIRRDVSINHAYFETSLPSPPHLEILVVRFSGTSGFGCANDSDAIYMDAMVRAGIAAFDSVGVILDLREMGYEWGDMMLCPFAAGSRYYVDSDLPVVAVVSDRNRKGLKSLMADEAGIDPTTVLFDTMDAALAHLDLLHNAGKNQT